MARLGYCVIFVPWLPSVAILEAYDGKDQNFVSRAVLAHGKRKCFRAVPKCNDINWKHVKSENYKRRMWYEYKFRAPYVKGYVLNKLWFIIETLIWIELEV